ncbi:MAG: UDP-N-acetylmuramate--L-alanine ligase [Bacteroidales bacterium]|nr:UDP-N-acetylmuramate--L-alanine ligase [Bacteroidales bacterium]
MIWTNLDNVYFIGAGGIGMSALARYFVSQGKTVAGYDRVSTTLTDELVREGITISFEDRSQLIPPVFRDPEHTLVIYTPAVPETHQQLNYFRKGGFRVIKRSVALGEVFNTGRGVGVAGTHGKTSISSMLAHILHSSTLGCNAFLGGISKNSSSNLYLDPASRVIIAEADEYDRSFLTLYPEIAVVSSMDADHLDIYHSPENMRKGFESYISQIREKGKLILKYGLNPAIPDHVSSFTYSVDRAEADYHVENLSIDGLDHSFTVITPRSVMPGIKLKIPGLLNVENALAAVAVAHQLGLTPDIIAHALLDYQGVRRRFDIQVNNQRRVYIDDYAHHPAEITAFLSSVRRLFPGKRITGIFQPHLFTRTRDFADEFARSLEMLDQLILMEIYPAREEPIPGVDAGMLLERVQLDEKVLIEREQLMRVVKERDPEVLVSMGAGDINQFVKPLQEWCARI